MCARPALPWPRRRSRPVVVDRLTVGPLLPCRGRELERREVGRWRERTAGIEHLLDVIVERVDERGGVDRVEPERLTVEQQQHDVGERAGTEAAADCQM